MNALLELRKQMEVDFLKNKTYEEINDMFNQLNDKLRLAEIELKKLRVGDVIKNEVAVCDERDHNNYRAYKPYCYCPDCGEEL